MAGDFSVHHRLTRVAQGIEQMDDPGLQERALAAIEHEVDLWLSIQILEDVSSGSDAEQLKKDMGGIVADYMRGRGDDMLGVSDRFAQVLKR